MSKFVNALRRNTHPLPGEEGKVPRWTFLRVAEVNWNRVGLGVEFSFGEWWPIEYSVYLLVGPVLLGVGIEEDMEWRYPSSPATPEKAAVEGPALSSHDGETTDGR